MNYTKYIPVDGQIEIGDKFLHKNIVKTYLTGTLPSECKKVKLFLCTKKVQVGDIVDTYAHQLQGKIIEIENGKIWIDPNINGVSGKQYSEWFDFNVLKVIGEISSDCNIKEGEAVDDHEYEIIDNIVYIK